MESIKARCTSVVQTEGRGQVVFSLEDKEKKVTKQVTLSYVDPKEVSKFEHGKTYTVEVKELK